MVGSQDEEERGKGSKGEGVTCIWGKKTKGWRAPRNIKIWLVSYFIFAFICRSVWYACGCMWRSEGNMWEFVLSFHYMDQTS